MANLKQWIEKAAEGELIEAVIIGNMGWADYKLEELPESARDTNNWNKPLLWDVAAPLLDYEFDSGYGAPGCQAIYAYTKTKVIFISQYDGATGYECIPRNPVECVPTMPGG